MDKNAFRIQEEGLFCGFDRVLIAGSGAGCFAEMEFMLLGFCRKDGCKSHHWPEPFPRKVIGAAKRIASDCCVCYN